MKKRRLRAATLVLGACGVFWAAAAEPLPAGSPGRAVTLNEYIEQRCTFCHSRILSMVLLNRVFEADGLTGVDAFLARHHMPDAEARKLILDYLDRASR